MKKFIRLIASRYFLAVVCIVLEFVQLLAVFLYLYGYFFPITILGWALQFVVLLYIINRNDIPEFKLPWFLLLFLLPVAGAFIFLLFSTNEVSKKERERHAQAMDALQPHGGKTGAEELLRERSEAAFRQAAYLHTAAAAPCYAGTKIDYYPLGEALYPALCRALEQAEHFIFMEYFIIQEGQVWNSLHEILKKKAAEGVQVYVMYDDFGCMMAGLPDKYDKLLRAEGIHAIPSNKLRPVFTRRHNNRDHRKITVVDGLVGFTGGINLSDRYMNLEEVFGHWKDTAIRLEGPAVRSLTAMFLSAWNTQNPEPLDVRPFMEIQPPAKEDGCFAVPFGDGPEPLYHDYIGENMLLNMIYSATKYVYITTPYLVCDHALLNALRTAAKRGVDVRVITPHIPDKKTVFLMTRSNYLPLVSDGVKIYEYTPGFIHAKNYIADDEIAACGSINLDYRSLVHNYECGVWFYKSECISAMREDFLRTVGVSEEITPTAARQHGLKRFLSEILKILSTLM